jgi:hypothetical protein
MPIASLNMVGHLHLVTPRAYRGLRRLPFDQHCPNSIVTRCCLGHVSLLGWLECFRGFIIINDVLGTAWDMSMSYPPYVGMLVLHQQIEVMSGQARYLFHCSLPQLPFFPVYCMGCWVRVFPASHEVCPVSRGCPIQFNIKAGFPG